VVGVGCVPDPEQAINKITINEKTSMMLSHTLDDLVLFRIEIFDFIFPRRYAFD
jgi:hypothetical protein